MKKARLLVEGACYHINTRGNQKQKVFRCDDDYLFFLGLLKKLKRKYRAKIYGWCLMPNHVHMVTDVENPEWLSKVMHGLNRTYTQYFNNKYEKVGHLWQNRFRSRVITKDQYLIDCINYVELNPVRAKLVKSPAQYRWSSYRARVLGIADGITDTLSL